MTRRYPPLKKKQAERDSKIGKRLIHAWDVEHDSDKVFNIFMKDKHLLSDFRYWEMLRTVWIVCGSVERSPEFRKLMKANRKHKHYFSTPEEAEELRGLPDGQFMVYRATNNMNDGGLSWTFDYKYAAEYQTMFSKKFIIEMTVTKDEVYALINRNNEREVIIFELNGSENEEENQ